MDRLQDSTFLNVDIRKRLAKNLRRIRTEKGLSQEQLSFDAGIHRTFISDLERASRNPSIKIIDKLAVGLKVTVGQLLD